MNKFTVSAILMWVLPLMLVIAMDKVVKTESAFKLLPFLLWIWIAFIDKIKNMDVVISFLAGSLINSVIIFCVYGHQNMVGVTILLTWIMMAIILIPISIIKNVRS